MHVDLDAYRLAYTDGQELYNARIVDAQGLHKERAIAQFKVKVCRPAAGGGGRELQT